VVGALTTVVVVVGADGKKMSPQPPVTGLIELSVNTIAVKVAIEREIFIYTINNVPLQLKG
jgi:hypothetical protein